MHVAADAPYVQIVHIVHTRNAANLAGYPIQFHTARRAFQQNVQGLADDAER